MTIRYIAAFASIPLLVGGGLGFWTSQEAMGAGMDSYVSYTDFGKAYQHNPNGGGRQAMNEIMGDMLDCDVARVYNAKTVRRVAATMDE